MSKKVLAIFCVILLIGTAFVITSCASKKTPTSTVEEPTATTQPTTAPTSTNTPGSGVTVSPTPTATSGSASLYPFDSTLNGWTHSTYSNPPNDGELGITGESITTTEKYAGAGSAALTCNFTGDLGASTSAKEAFKLNVSASPVNMTGKTITVHVYVPTALTQAPYNSNPYGAKVYIKTGSSWTWADGGWNNLLTPGWNTFTFSPSGVGEADTKEVGIQIGKGTGSPDWAGTIYVDEINW